MNNHEYFMNRALSLATEALTAGEFPVGCVLVAGDKIVSNGTRQHSRDQVNETDHAEIMALRHLLRTRPDIDPSTITVYSTLEPCLMCYATLLVNNIRTVVYAYEDAMGGGTCLPLHDLPPLYQAMRPNIIPHIKRQESLRLFQEFFRNPASNYLTDTYLAQYTLQQ